MEIERFAQQLAEVSMSTPIKTNAEHILHVAMPCHAASLHFTDFHLPALLAEQ